MVKSTKPIQIGSFIEVDIYDADEFDLLWRNNLKRNLTAYPAGGIFYFSAPKPLTGTLT
jgi:hypothetical protein